MSSFRLEIVTPERSVVSTDVEAVLIPAEQGRLGVWANHAPLVAAVKIGVLEYGSKHAAKRKVAIGGGFVEMAENTLTVLGTTAELAEEIDVLRARAAKERAEQRLRDQQTDWDFRRAQVALEKAMARLRAVDDSE